MLFKTKWYMYRKENTNQVCLILPVKKLKITKIWLLEANSDFQKIIQLAS